MRKLLLAGMVLLVFAGIEAASAANLVANGGFESPALGISSQYQLGMTTGLQYWTIEAGNIDLMKRYWTPAAELQSIDLTGTQRGTISQFLTTTKNGPYVLSFKMSGNFGCGAQTFRNVTVYWDGSSTPVGTYSFQKPGSWSRTNMGWTAKSVLLPAPATASTKLTFVDTTAGTSTCGAALDDIIVEQQAVAVPEFPALALPVGAIIGILGAVFYIRSTREE
jgi:hypothetical protein